MIVLVNIVFIIILCLCYCDVWVVIVWLQCVFGFELQVVYVDGDIVYYVQLVYGYGMIMLGLVDNGSVWGCYSVQLDEVGGCQIQSVCVIVVDFDVYYVCVVVVGVEVVIVIVDQDYGGCGYVCCDFEGYLWWFGSYDFWQVYVGGV